jgi:hypothetical protein
LLGACAVLALCEASWADLNYQRSHPPLIALVSLASSQSFESVSAARLLNLQQTTPTAEPPMPPS